MNNQLPQDAIDCIVAPLLTPSGVWADFNPIWMYWHAVQNLCERGFIPKVLLPPEPDPRDYTDYVTERTWFVPEDGFDVVQRL